MCQPNFHPSTKPKLSIHSLPRGPKSSPLLACHVANNFYLLFFNSLISFFLKKKQLTFNSLKIQLLLFFLKHFFYFTKKLQLI